MFKRINNINILKPSLFIVLTLILTAAGIALRTLNIIFFFDYDIGYYQSDAVLPLIMNIFFVVSVSFFAAASIFLTRIPESFSGHEKNPFTIVASSVCILTFLALAVNSLLFYMKLPMHITAVYAIISIISSLYFISNILNFGGQYRALLTIPVIVNFVFILAISYFDVTVQMNSPEKILLHITALASIFLFISEARCIFEPIRKKSYLFWLCAALFFSGVYSVPSLICFISDGVTERNFISFIIIFFAIFVYLLTRAVTVMMSEKIATAEDIANIDDQNSQEEDKI